MSKFTNGPRTHRELRLYSAGQQAGMRNLYMAMAANKGRSKTERAHLVREARQHHWTYLARLREANGAVGYYMPEVKDTPANYSLPVDAVRMTVRQAS